MAESGLGPAETSVRAQDPALFRELLFVRDPGRSRLMLLHALDIELGRAVAKSARGEAGPVIGAMRLQFWRDTVTEAYAGAEPRRHEIAAPLAALIRETAPPAEDFEALARGHEAEMEPTGDAEAYARWAVDRFGALMRLSLHLLGAPGAASEATGAALAAAHALRTAAVMAGAGRALIPGLSPADRAMLAEGTVTDTAAEAIRRFSETGLAAHTAARQDARALPAAARPAALPLWRAGRDLATGCKGRLPSPDGPNPARHLLALLSIVLKGRP